ncbi:hypothetical protein [Streptomyces roseifaciens]|uniref:hypothetical protein n=1 Tax=Streptomyces roseifaciens TaxID=1488406 RepID=UPI000717F9A9|nr:hypothetical protein [Streptomyces roseifaciens]
MPDSAPLSVHATDTVTPNRQVRHDHFAPGDRVVVIRGSLDGDLHGDDLTVVAPSWHTPTGQDGWRTRNPNGGTHTFTTAHPRYLIHVEQHCPDCVAFFRALAAELLPQLPKRGCTEGDWYQFTALDQLVHRDDYGLAA